MCALHRMAGVDYLWWRALHRRPRCARCRIAAARAWVRERVRGIAEIVMRHAHVHGAERRRHHLGRHLGDKQARWRWIAASASRRSPSLHLFAIWQKPIGEGKQRRVAEAAVKLGPF